MGVQVEIITGSRTVFQYLAKPVIKNLNESFIERRYCLKNKKLLLICLNTLLCAETITLGPIKIKETTLYVKNF